MSFSNNFRKPLIALALLGGSMLSTPALAIKTIDIKIEYTGYSLVDLDTTDNILPTIQFLGNFNAGNVSTRVTPNGQGTNGFTSAYDPQGNPMQLSLNYANGGVNGTANWNGLLNGSQSLSSNLNANQWVSGNAGGNQFFSLSGNTRLKVFMHVTGHSLVENNTDAENIVMETGFNSFLNMDTGNVYSLRNDVFKQNYNEYGSKSIDQYFTLYTDNEYGDTSTGTLYSGVSLNSNFVTAPIPGTGTIPGTDPTIPTQPIPEPETYALMGAGLLMLAAMQRRKKRQA